MRIPLTQFGRPQVIIYPSVLGAAIIACVLLGAFFLPAWATTALVIALAALFVWTLAFFRDPHREVPDDNALLLAPADGTITDIETVNETSFLDGAAIRIGIFLSIFDVHINRSPCAARVEKITYRKGRFTNAMFPSSGRVNESNDLYLTRLDEPAAKLIVRQIAGAIARRIVWASTEGDTLAAGEKFGMIKFGSRTELYWPAQNNIELLIKLGDKVKAGVTPLAQFKTAEEPVTAGRPCQ